MLCGEGTEVTLQPALAALVSQSSASPPQLGYAPTTCRNFSAAPYVQYPESNQLVEREDPRGGSVQRVPVPVVSLQLTL